MKFKISNNMIALLLIIFNILIIFNVYTLIQRLDDFGVTPEEDIIGAAVATLSLCLSPSDGPIINIFYPDIRSVTNHTINITANLTNQGNNAVYNLTFAYIYNSVTTNIAKDTKDNDVDFNSTWDTSSVADGNCNYRIRVTGTSNETYCDGFYTKTTDLFTIDNAFVEPTWTNFMNTFTTNFSTYSRWSNLTDVVIGNDFGKLNFSGTNWNFDGMDLDDDVAIGNNSINFTLTSDCFSEFSFSTRIYLTNLTFTDTKIIRNNLDCPSSVCTNIHYRNNTLSFDTNRVGNYSGFENFSINVSSNLDIFDDTDPERNTQVKYAHEYVMFYANYTSNETNLTITGNQKYCEVEFNETGQYTSPVNMSYNSTSKLYEYPINFSARGNYSWNVYCQDETQAFLPNNMTDMVFITNTPPNLSMRIPNLQWDEDIILTGLNLNDYFDDQDDDTLTFTHSNITNILIVIASDGVVSFIPENNWFGLRRITFTANDSINITISNNISLTVVDISDAVASPPGPSGAGGGGGGGATLRCFTEWYCTPWGPCINEVRKRECYDLNNCGSKNKPNETSDCVYVASCYDNTCNNGEDCVFGMTELVDCGGPCPACFTCYDRQHNQDETDIDCGGQTCDPCRDGKKCLTHDDCESQYCNPDKICSIPSCTDGWQNHDEEGIDCGGPCPKCPIKEQPTVVPAFFTPQMLVILAIVLLILLLLNLFGKDISRIVYSAIYKKGIFEKKLERLIKYAQISLVQLEKILNEKNSQKVLARVHLIFMKFIQSAFDLRPNFTIVELREALKTSTLNTKFKRVFLLYYENILSHKRIKVTKREVAMLISQGKRLLSFLATNKGKR